MAGLTGDARHYRIPSLDGLRTLSIILVLIGHQVSMNQAGKAARFAENASTLGVRVFFVISGFLITGLLLKELDRTDRIDLRAFYTRRTLRIFPAYFVMLGGVAFLGVLGLVQISEADLLAAATYTSNYYPDRSWVVGHTWSLAVEEQFYLVWPLTLSLLGLRRGRWVPLLVIVLVPLLRLALSGVPDYQIGKTFETSADAIAMGCSLAIWNGWLRERAAFRVVTRPVALIGLAAIVVGLTALQSGRAGFKWAVAYPVVNACIALIVVGVTGSRENAIGRLLNSAPFVFVGTLSYSIYLWQQVFFSHGLGIAEFPLNFVLIFGVALASYYLVENPVLRWRDRRRRATAEDATTRVEGT